MKDTSRIPELLPIGSVVLLKDAQKPLMVFGVCQTEKDTGKEYDYIGVLYPEGNVGTDVQFLFNHADISKTYFMGYDAPERAEFLQRLKAYYDQKNDTQPKA